MERRSWPWSKKASAKVPKTSFKNVEGPPLVYVEGRPRIEVDNASVLEAVALREQAEEKVKSLMDKLTSVVKDLTAKEDLVKQHGKVAEDAVSGWEKAEAEALSLKEELEASIHQRKVVEDRVAHLDGALKDCMRQEQKIQEAIVSKTREWDKIKVELDAKAADLVRRLMESDAQNSAMSKSLQERAGTIEEVKEEKARAETEVKLLQVKLDSLEKEIAALKYELHVLSKELEIRNEEREYSRKSADAAHKQHLENVKKIAKLESECQRLRTLVRKKLPGPAALTQMKMEIDGFGECKRRNFSSGSKGPPSPPSAGFKHQIRDYAAKEVEVLTDRMLSMEEETKMLKEALTKRSAELQAARQLCARTASKLSVAEDQLESLHGTPRESRNGIDLHTERSFACKSEDGIVCTDDEVSCAESWASALISELAHFKRNRATSHVSRQSMESSNFDTIEEFLETERNAALESSPTVPVHHSPVDKGSIITENDQLQISQSLNEQEPRTLNIIASNADKLQTASLSCKEVNCNLSLVEEQLRALESQNNEDSETISFQVQGSLKVLVDSRQIVSKLDGVLDELLFALASMNRKEDNEANPYIAEQFLSSVSKAKPVGSLRFIMCKLIMLLEMLLRPHLALAPLQTVDGSLPYQSTTDSSLKSGCPATSQFELQMHGLMIAKENCLQGKASLLEFLLRLGVVLSGLCGMESSELEHLLSEEVTAPGTEEKEKAADGGREAALAELLGCTEAKAMELEKQLSGTDEELKRTTSELAKTKELVTDLQGRITKLQAAEKKLAEEESMRAELQDRLQKAEEQVRELEGNVAKLRVELAEQQKRYEGALAKCEELEQQLLGFSNPQRTNSRKITEDEEARLKKERELAVARENLAECQRTISVLGQQLKALSSPLAHSPPTSFDSTSLGSASLDRRVYSARELLPSDDMQPSSRFATNRDGQMVHLHHHHRRRPPVSCRNEPPPPYDYEPPLWSPSRSCYVQEPGYYVPSHQRHSRHMAPDLRLVEGNGVRSQLSPINDHPVKYPDRLALTVYSPSPTSMSSPSGSPATILQLGAQRSSGNAVRTNLAKSMNRAASGSSNSIKSSKSASSSRFRQFFSRSKNCS